MSDDFTGETPAMRPIADGFSADRQSEAGTQRFWWSLRVESRRRRDSARHVITLDAAFFDDFGAGTIVP